MELCAGKVHVLWIPSLIKTVQQAQDTILQALVDPTRPALAPKSGQALMLEGPYHPVNVIYTMTRVN
jgi:hypothetical protein